MIVTYTIDTPMLEDGRRQAVSLAKAMGYPNVTVLDIFRTNTGAWEVKLQLFK
jgi:hypothetical protein